MSISPCSPAISPARSLCSPDDLLLQLWGQQEAVGHVGKWLLRYPTQQLLGGEAEQHKPSPTVPLVSLELPLPLLISS